MDSSFIRLWDFPKRWIFAIENGTILKIEKNIDTDQVSNDTEILDATGLVVAPGLIDTHVHFRQ